MNMTWEQKLAAIQALPGVSVSLKMRCPGNWYVECLHREVATGGTLVGAYGNGSTPQEAVEDDWRQIVDELPPEHYITTGGRSPGRNRLRWNGFMWAEVTQ